MDSQDKIMCAMADYDHELYDEDYLGNLNRWDFLGGSLDGDVGLPEDFASKLGPIPLPSDMLQLVGCGGPTDLLGFGTNMETYEPKYHPIRIKEPFKSHLKPQPPPTFSLQKNLYRIPKSFKAPSPDSVLERCSPTSSQKSVSFGTEISIPVRIRTKRPLPSSTSNSWSKITLQKKTKKRRKNPSPQQQQSNNENKKCSHCEITQTPQWREGPMGPKTLCNACGVRYRSGRLFPEYRPAASPTFIPSLHSNSHRKVIEMRQKGAGMDDDKFVVKKDFNSNSTNVVRLCS